MELINKTGKFQQINLISKSIKVKPGENVKFNEKDIYDHELKRALKFFNLKKVEKSNKFENKKQVEKPVKSEVS